jgi:hypothetical protein
VPGGCHSRAGRPAAGAAPATKQTHGPRPIHAAPLIQLGASASPPFTFPPPLPRPPPADITRGEESAEFADFVFQVGGAAGRGWARACVRACAGFACLSATHHRHLAPAPGPPAQPDPLHPIPPRPRQPTKADTRLGTTDDPGSLHSGRIVVQLWNAVLQPSDAQQEMQAAVAAGGGRVQPCTAGPPLRAPSPPPPPPGLPLWQQQRASSSAAPTPACPPPPLSPRYPQACSSRS